MLQSLLTAKNGDKIFENFGLRKTQLQITVELSKFWKDHIYFGKQLSWEQNYRLVFLDQDTILIIVVMEKL